LAAAAQRAILGRMSEAKQIVVFSGAG